MFFKPILRQLSPSGAKGRLTILIFHRVVPELDSLHHDLPDRHGFDQILGWMRRWFEVLPLDDAAARLAQGRLPERAAAITFDDGYADNATVALPALQRHGLTATFFIATDYLDGGRMWNDTVAEAIRTCRQDSLDLRDLSLAQYPLADMAARRHAVGDILRRIKHLPPALRQQQSDAIAERCDVRPPDDLMMQQAQVQALHAGGMQIGAHTQSHPILATLDDASVLAELQGSRSVLENIVQAPVSLFAYPNGVPDQDYLHRHLPLVRQAGFEVAVTTAPGAAAHGADPLQLPRFTPWDRQGWRFAARLARNMTTPIRVANPADVRH